MSYDDFARPAGGATGQLPGWAARANEPLVRTIDVTSVKRTLLVTTTTSLRLRPLRMSSLNFVVSSACHTVDFMYN